jgi:hypothetical protein
LHTDKPTGSTHTQGQLVEDIWIRVSAAGGAAKDTNLKRYNVCPDPIQSESLYLIAPAPKGWVFFLIQF